MLDEGKGLEDLEPKVWPVLVRMQVQAATEEAAEGLVSDLLEEVEAVTQYGFLIEEESDDTNTSGENSSVS